MTELEYLHQGLSGLARAHKANPMAGHLGAAVVAGYLFQEDQPELDERVGTAIKQDLDRIIRGEEGIWYDAKKTGISIPQLFEPVALESPREDRLDIIAQALAANIDKTRQSGHNVIFAGLAIRALRDHPRFATPPIIDGVRKLIQGFNGAVSGRGYYGKERGWIGGDKVTLPAETDFAPYTDLQAMVNVVMDELISSASIRRQGFGGLFHIINHAAGLVELFLFGYRDLALLGLVAHHHHVRLWRSLPDVEDELGSLKKSQHDPRTPEYWADNAPSPWSARLTHRIKTLYGFFTLLRMMDDSETREKATDSFRYLMA